MLGCDAKAVHTMSTALWGTLADVSEKDEASKLCLILEDIPRSALESFVSDFAILQTQERLMQHLPELKRISVSILETGPALVMEATQRTPDELAEKQKRTSEKYDQTTCIASLKSFIQRIVIQENACPYTKSVEIAATGLEAKGVQPGPVAYRFSDTADGARTLAVFWDCVCELLSTPETTISTTMLSLPGIGPGTSPQSLERFSAVMEIVSRYLCLYRGDSSFGLVHFHPAYDRDQIHPVHRPAYGHLPPRSWLRPMLRRNGNTAEATSLTDADLALSDHQRRAPFTAINILRATQLNAAAGPKSIVDLEVADGVFEKASGILLYSRNAIALARIGKETLEAGLKADRAIFLQNGRSSVPIVSHQEPLAVEESKTTAAVAVAPPVAEDTASATATYITKKEYQELLSEFAAVSNKLKELELKLIKLNVKD